jgi:serine O-acetyltransferase
MPQDIYSYLLHSRRKPLIGRLAYYLLKLLGAEVPISVPVGAGTRLEHGGFGVVIHSKARIGRRVKLYPGVTIGRADIYRPAAESEFQGVEIADDAILCPGAKVLCKAGVLRVGRGALIGANAVLLESAGEGEIWAGVPARCIGKRVIPPVEGG